MNVLEEHEIFEIEVLDKLNNPRLEGEGFTLDWHFVEIRRF